MKIAIVHDYIKEYGGAEKVLEELHNLFPKAPIYTTVYLPRFLGPHRKRFEKMDIKPSVLQYIPFKSKLISPLRLLAIPIFKFWNFSKYDLVIVSATGAYQPNLINKGKAIHICYCHTPPRYLYGYPTARNWQKLPGINILASVVNHFLRMVDYKSAQNVDLFIANSKEIKARIERFYRKDSVVVYPPVSLSTTQKTIKKEDFYLAGGRLARPKRVDLAIKAANKLKLPLIVFGKGFAGYGKELEKIAGKTIKFVGEVSEKEKIKLMSQAKAFIFPAEEEDFGITPVEVMSVGTPVIAFYSGGVKESVIEGKTGVFFEKASVDSLVSVIKKFEKIKIDSKECIKQSLNFSKENFDKQIKKIVKKYA
ncbi:glycosyltransferase [Patescibacteria group bacterium]|nr:glycosyltransferase [Patescibacteria group bacterium]